ncbi:MAG: sulfotransferase domain-containing protein [Jatrophihabitantaceae bacterium]
MNRSGGTAWLASYPKSGNTWFRAVVAAWRRGDPFDLEATDTIPAFRTRFDESLGVRSTDLTDTEAAALRPAADDVHDSVRPELHLHKIHDGLFTGPDGACILSTAATHRAIYVVRDPRDVAVSFAHHNGQSTAWATERLCTPSAEISAPVDDVAVQLVQRLGTWSEHVAGWVEHAPFPTIGVRYEDCLTDPVRTFGEAFAFVGFEIPPDELRAAIDAAAFARLQARERQVGFGERFSRSAPFFRKGKAGGWRDELEPALAERISSEHAEQLRRFGYSLR